MALPTPTPQQVTEFKQIYLEEFGKELTDSEAWEVATITLQLFFLGTYGRRINVTAVGTANHNRPTTWT